MKRISLCCILAMYLLATSGLMGCATASSTTPPAALAPGYLSTTDQTLGESLAAANAFVHQEIINYSSLTAAQQATEKVYLNNMVLAVNTANTAYLAYHQTPTSTTLSSAQTAVTGAQTAQAALAKAKGVN